MEIPQNAYRPQDHLTTAAPAMADADPEKDAYEWHAPDGRTYRIPPAYLIKMGEARRMRHLPEGEQILQVLEKLCDEETLAAIDELDGREFAIFHADWQRWQLDLGKKYAGSGDGNGVTMGESSA